MENITFMEPSADCDRVIYTPSDFSREHLLYLQEAGHLVATKAHSSHRENLKSYLLIAVEYGSGQLNYEGNSYSLSSGDCAFIDCNSAYTHTTNSDPWALSWVHFYSSQFSAVYDKYFRVSEHVKFTPHNLSIISQQISDLELLANSDLHLRDVRIHEKLTMICAGVIEEANRAGILETPSNCWPEILCQIKDYLETNYYKQISLDELSQKFYVNKFTMIRYFKLQYGLSPVAFLLHLRITHSKELLRFSNISIGEIAFRSGFQDGNYFARSFKKIELITPSEYRKHWATVGETK